MRISLLIIAFLLSCSCGSHDKIVFIKGKSSVEKQHYKDGILISLESYSADTSHLNGECLYYRFGRLQKQVFYRNDTLCGSHTEYSASGEVKLYVCHDSYSDTMFYRSYDNSGQIQLEGGGFEVPTAIEGKYWDEHKMVLVYSYIVDAPHTSYEVDNFFLSDTKDTIRPIQNETTWNWRHIYYFKVPKLGTYLYAQKVSIVDSQKGKKYIYLDSSSSRIEKGWQGMFK